MRKKRPLDRKTKLRDTSLVVIASEDKYAVRQYFDFFRSTRIQFKVLETEDGKSAPEHVINRLLQYRQEYDIGDGDQFWVVLDCDHWIEPGHIKNLIAVMQECRQKNIRVALSHPCFDLWLLLHFAEFPAEAELSCENIGEKIRAIVGGYNKSKIYSLPIDAHRVAKAINESSKNEPGLQEIPTQPKTAVHWIIQQLLRQKIVAVMDA